jgi:hypothetical protein
VTGKSVKTAVLEASLSRFLTFGIPAATPAEPHFHPDQHLKCIKMHFVILDLVYISPLESAQLDKSLEHTGFTLIVADDGIVNSLHMLKQRSSILIAYQPKRVPKLGGIQDIPTLQRAPLKKE